LALALRSAMTGIRAALVRSLLVGSLLAAPSGCTTQTTDLESAQHEVPFHIRVPASSALPKSVEETPLIDVRRERIPGPSQSSAAGEYAYTVDLDYRYRPGLAPSGFAQASAITITEYQNPGGETQLVAVPTGGQPTEIDGREVVVSRSTNVLGAEIVWVQDRTGFDVRTTLGWGDTLSVLRSMAGSPVGTGTPTVQSSDGKAADLTKQHGAE